MDVWLHSSVPTQTLAQLVLGWGCQTFPPLTPRSAAPRSGRRPRSAFPGSPGGRRHAEAAMKSFIGGMEATGVCPGCESRRSIQLSEPVSPLSAPEPPTRRRHFLQSLSSLDVIGNVSPNCQPIGESGSQRYQANCFS